MSRGTPALVQPSLLIWARESAGVQVEDAAKKMELPVETIVGWERGDDRPSIPQLRKLGEIYKRPLAVFFLPAPPKGFDAQREFRRLAGLTPQNESPELRQALRLSLFRREAAREIYERLGEEIPSTGIAAHPAEDPEAVGGRIREALGISWETQIAWRDPQTAWRAWRAAIERQGVLVFQAADIDVNEMRGTSIPEGPLPVIVINNADSPHGKIFTLVHEFAHVLLFNGGHRTSTMEGRRLPEDQILERASNRIAAAALMPRDKFLADLARYPGVTAGDEDTLRRFSQRIKVSPEAILRRLLTFRRVSVSLYRQKRRGWMERSWYQLSGAAGPIPIETRVLSSVGRGFVSLVVDGYQRNAVSSADVSDYLGIQLKFLSKITDALTPAPGSLGAR